MQKYFAYTRVSTLKQGEGVSLQEQRDTIVRYATRHQLEIEEWFEEKETAAKRGRPVFSRMLKLLQKGKASGVLIHKIDRSARNLKDWADLGALIDQGIDVHFVNEGLDLHSRGGRLSADIQAVVAADYIRNLREETRKGFYGRLKQGLYPLPAPLGYLDMGRGKAKKPDPAKAPLVRKAFELYASGRYNLKRLVEDMSRYGLRNRNGSKVSMNGFSIILNNPFYMGLIRLKRTGETFPGLHSPLVPKSLFDRVQQILQGKTHRRLQRYEFLFRRMISCRQCQYSLIGESQKGHTYYRCHTRSCRTKCVREEKIESHILARLMTLRFDEQEKVYFTQKIHEMGEDLESRQDAEIQALRLRLDQVHNRLARLTDAYIDQTIDKQIFEERKAALLMERQDMEEKMAFLQEEGKRLPNRLTNFLELAGSAYSSWKLRLPDEKRDFLRILTSNRCIDRENIYFKLSLPFSEVSNRWKNAYGAPQREIPRTWDRLLGKLTDFFKSNLGPGEGQ